MKKVELLAPAGTMESFYGALNAGADAIYLAGEKYGARAYAKNFTSEELVEVIQVAHIYGKKVYLTVNTLLKQEESEELYGFLKPLYEAGLDGVILQDLGVAKIMQTYFPEMELHASTQMTLTGENGANYLKEQGFSRIVPARELSLSEIKEIRKNSDIELECFVHGAMCYCYSGQCLFSSVLGGRSGNRGRCAQPCRLHYTVTDEHGQTTSTCYPLSMKDQETILFINELIEAGIDSFKIEGRMKKPEYAAGVTAIYRRAIDAYYRTGKATVSKADLEGLSKLYRRSEKQEGYYHLRNGKEMITLDSPSYNGADEKYLSGIREAYVHKPDKLLIQGYADFTIGQNATLTLNYGDLYVTATGDVCQLANAKSVSKDTIQTQIDQLGNTVFALSDLQINASENLFYSLKRMKDLRREAVSLLMQAIISENGLPGNRTAREYVTESNFDSSAECLAAHGYRILISTKEQWDVILHKKCGLESITYLYLDCAFALSLSKEQIDAFHACHPHTLMFLATPYVIRNNNKALLEKCLLREKDFDGYLIRNMESFAYLQKNGIREERFHLDANMYLTNDDNREWWQGKIGGYCLPLEMTLKEQQRIASKNHGQTSIEKIAYGKIPMMVTANCLAKTTGTCFGNGHYRYALADRYQISFDVEISCENCYNIIYNSVPSVSIGCQRTIGEYADLRLQFTTENATEMCNVLSYFAHGADSKPTFSYTTGFDKKNVE